MTDEIEPQRSLPIRPLVALAAVLASFAAVLVVAGMRLSETVRVRMSITIDRPVDEVFAFVSDARNVPRWLPVAVERRKTTAGPVGLGTRFEATDRIAGRLVPHTQEIIAFEPGRLITTRLSAPWAGEYEIRVEPIDEGTLLSVDSTSRPSGATRLFGLVPESLVRRQFEQDYAQLKDLLEDQSEPIVIPIEPEAEPVAPAGEELAAT